MKGPEDVNDDATIAHKRALIRSLIEQTGWAQANAAINPPADDDAKIEYFPGIRPAACTSPAQEEVLAEIIPFPGAIE